MQAVFLANAMFGGWPKVMDLDEEKRGIATKLGCEAYDPRDAKAAVRAIRKATGTKKGVQAAVDFVGAEATFKTCFDAIRTGGSLVAVGLFGAKLELSLPMFIMGQKSLIGSLTGNLAEAKELIALLQSKSVSDSVPSLCCSVAVLAEGFTGCLRWW